MMSWVMTCACLRLLRWYSQAGTPELTVSTQHNPSDKTYTIRTKQVWSSGSLIHRRGLLCGLMLLLLWLVEAAACQPTGLVYRGGADGGGLGPGGPHSATVVRVQDIAHAEQGYGCWIL